MRNHPVAPSAHLVGLALAAYLMPAGGAVAADETAPYRINHELRGCWTYEQFGSPPRRQRGHVILCFGAGRGVYFGRIGLDGSSDSACIRWRALGRSLLLRDTERVDDCRYEFSPDRQTLHLAQCEWPGDYRREEKRSPSPCRTQEVVTHEEPDEE